MPVNIPIKYIEDQQQRKIIYSQFLMMLMLLSGGNKKQGSKNKRVPLIAVNVIVTMIPMMGSHHLYTTTASVMADGDKENGQHHRHHCNLSPCCTDLACSETYGPR